MTDDEEKALAEIERRLLVPVRTAREIASVLGLSRQTVLNIEGRALEKMRKRAEGWAGGLDEESPVPRRSEGVVHRHARKVSL